ncbi:uncharacterized protein LOC126842150 [Adelges cooleyi]|uniref:uncharacterized protein LOC126842150 n=1 Tax=Adelges cooleyi TaxID=133065 RepID=UPI00217FF4E1|nr:uncharacterized protein LOC126842150 [Adelges cooleyi]
MYGDTDSLVYLVKTKDFYAEVTAHPEMLKWFDTSNLPSDHPAYSVAKKKIPGLFSDETNGLTVYEFISLRPKSYAFEKETLVTSVSSEKIRAKGIRGHVVKNHLTVSDFKSCLFAKINYTSYTPYRENISIRSYKHEIKTIKNMKITLNWHDDKRVILPDRIHTLAIGHYKLIELQQQQQLQQNHMQPDNEEEEEEEEEDIAN